MASSMDIKAPPERMIPAPHVKAINHSLLLGYGWLVGSNSAKVKIKQLLDSVVSGWVQSPNTLPTKSLRNVPLFLVAAIEFGKTESSFRVHTYHIHCLQPRGLQEELPGSPRVQQETHFTPGRRGSTYD